jgi:6,7-dimethyl-8-ribityllumazine synthase
VAETVVGALMRVQLETEVPMISLMLTPHHFHEHQVHQKFFVEHLVQKGVEGAQAAVTTMEGLRRVRGESVTADK